MSDKILEASENDDEKEPEKLTPVEERQVDFYGDQITAALIRLADGQNQVYIPIKPICDCLGVDSQAQTRRIRRDAVLSEYFKGVAIMATPSSNKRSAGGVQTALALPLEILPGWLFGLDANRVKPDLKEKIIRYQRECFKVLWQAFQTETTETINFLVSGSQETQNAVTESSIVDFEDYEAGIDERLAAREPTESQIALMQIREMGLSVARLADQQLEIERKADRANERLDAARNYLLRLQTRFDQCITAFEDRLTPPVDYITEEQVSRLQLEVKALAGLLTNRDHANKRQNHYQGIFNELYRRYGVSSYTHIRIGQFATVMQFLADWKHAADNNISNEVFLQRKLF